MVTLPTRFRAFAGGTFDVFHPGHLFFIRKVYEHAESLTKEEGMFQHYGGVELILFVADGTSAERSKGRMLLNHRAEDRAQRIRQEKSLEDYLMPENIYVLPPDPDEAEMLRRSFVIDGEPFAYYFGHDQFETGWAKSLREFFLSNYVRLVEFFWIDETYYREKYKSSILAETQKKQTYRLVSPEDDLLGVSGHEGGFDEVFAELTILQMMHEHASRSDYNEYKDLTEVRRAPS